MQSILCKGIEYNCYHHFINSIINSITHLGKRLDQTEALLDFQYALRIHPQRSPFLVVNFGGKKWVQAGDDNPSTACSM